MKKMKKRRILCLLLAVLMVAAILPLPANAAAAYSNTHVNTGSHRADIIGVARTQVGYRETMNNKTKYGAWYGLDNNPWCAMIISWCARQAGIPTSILRNSTVASPDRGYFRIACYSGETYTPVPGDLYFKLDESHVGLVYHVDGEYFYSIEGNANNDGTTNGNRVLSKKLKIAEYKFGVPNYNEDPGPAAPVVSTEQKEYMSGRTVRIQWTEVENAESYSLIVYYNGDIVYSENMGLMTEAQLTSVEAGEYLVSVAANYADGTEGFGQHGFDVLQAPSLNVQYNINGGEISPKYQYVVIGGDGVVLRSTYSTSGANRGTIPVGTLLTAENVKAANGYTWGKVSYNGRSGWCIVNKGYCSRVGYGVDTSAETLDSIFRYPTGEPAVTKWSAGSDERKALLDPQTAGISKQYHTFAGWTTALDGSAPVFRQDQTQLSAADIEPAFVDTDMTVTMYALWRKTVDAITIKTLPDKLEYYTEDSLDTTGLQIRANYADGTEEVLSSGFILTGFDSRTPGTKQVTVDYGGKTATFEVTVNTRMQYTEENGTIVITGYVQGGGVVIIPSNINGVPVTAIAPGAFAGCDQITGIVLPSSVTQIGDGAFSGCSALSVVNYTGSREQWDAIDIGVNNEPLLNAELNCDYLVLGDYTGDMKVDNNDVIYLLWHTLFPADFPVATTADLNADGIVDNNDVITLLWHTLFPDSFPLLAAMPAASDAPAEEPAEEPVEEPVEDPAKEPVEESTEEPAAESSDEENSVPAE